jgi:amino acid transporter
MPRVLFAAARDNVIPSKGLARVHQDYRTPHISILTYALLGFTFASIGEFKQLAMLSSASYLLIYLGVVLSVIKFRFRRRAEIDSYRIPGGYFVPGLSVIVIIWLLSNLPHKELGAMLIFVLILTMIYFVLRLLFNKKQKEKNTFVL